MHSADHNQPLTKMDDLDKHHLGKYFPMGVGWKNTQVSLLNNLWKTQIKEFCIGK